MTATDTALLERDFFRAFMGRAAFPDAHEALLVIRPDWFALGALRQAWRAVQYLTDQGADPDAWSLLQVMREHGASGAEIQTVQMELESPVDVSSLRPMVRALRETWTRRRMELIGNRLQGGAYTLDMAELLEGAAETLGEIQLLEARSDRYVVQDYADLVETAASGTPLYAGTRAENRIRFGIPKLDRALNAGPGTLGVVAAKTSAGKTSLAIQALLATAKAGKKALLISLEMEREEVGAKVAAHLSGMDSSEILRGVWGAHGLEPHGGFQVDYPTKSWLGNARGLHVPSGEPWAAIEAAIRREARKGLDCVILDYFTLIEAPDVKGQVSTAYRLGELSKAMRRLAAQLGLTICVLSQFNRGVEDGKEPSLENLRETGQLEQDAAYVVLLWTERAKYEPHENRIVNGRLAKNRNGARWVLARTEFNPKANRFTEQERETSSYSRAACAASKD
jgi:replicative DNA helicase